MLVINEKDNYYPIKVGAEVYKVEYPSFEEAQKIMKEFHKISGDNDKSLDLMIKWLKKLGLDEKFFKLKAIKAKHIMVIWGEINSVKK